MGCSIRMGIRRFTVVLPADTQLPKEQLSSKGFVLLSDIR